jgi:hypothetical protein
MEVGTIFEEWTILELRGRKALCKCSCGTEREVWRANLTSGLSQSCGEHRRLVFPTKGETIHAWTVLSRRRYHLHVRCSCGTKKWIYVYSILNGDSTSCGHARLTGPRARLRWMWEWMHSRCENPGDPMYRYYGARGVKVSDEWATFEPYAEWAIAAGFRKSRGLQIDRIDNNGPYSPSNCRVTTRIVNANNKSNNVRFAAFGEMKTVGEWTADPRCQVNYGTLWQRLRTGKDPEWSIAAPPQHTGGRPSRHDGAAS